jgi:hypothetical protein
MPASIRVRCLASDCQLINGLFCGSAEVELSPTQHCVTYKPIDIEEIDTEDEGLDEDDLLEEAEWLEDEEEEEDLDAYGSDDE